MSEICTQDNAQHQDVLRQSTGMPYALWAHLLPPRNKEWAAYKLSLEHPAIVERRTLDPKLTRVDLFTDGSCWFPEQVDFALGGALAVVHVISG